MRKGFKLLPVLAALALLLSACDIGSINGSYTLEVTERGKISGSIKSEITQERYEYLRDRLAIQKSIPIHGISYTWDAVNCEMDDIVVSLNGPTPKVWGDQTISFASLEFANIEEPVSFFGIGILDVNHSSANLMQNGQASFGCTNPGAYVQDSGFGSTFYLDLMLNQLGLQNWLVWQERNVAVGNIYPTDRPYLLALSDICAIADGNCVTPSEVYDTLAELLGDNSSFKTAIDAPWEKGQFVNYLHDHGINTYRTVSGGWGVEVPFTNMSLDSLSRDSGESDYAVIPNMTSIDGLTFSLDSTFTHMVSGEDEITDPISEPQNWQMESQALAAISQSIKISGLVLDTNGIYNKKNKTFTWSINGYGPDASYTAEKPSIVFAPGIVVTFKANSSKLTLATKKLLKSKKTMFQAYGDTLIGAVTNSSLSPDKAVANQELAVKRANAVKNYLQNTLKLNFNYQVVTTPSSDTGSSWAKASVNKVVISTENPTQ